MQESYKKGFFGELRDDSTAGYSANSLPSGEEFPPPAAPQELPPAGQPQLKAARLPPTTLTLILAKSFTLAVATRFLESHARGCNRPNDVVAKSDGGREQELFKERLA
jgi:hypothetical protein